MPLHDHPNMYVFQKVLEGKFSIRVFKILKGIKTQMNRF